jgi:hypothetical protein
VPNPLIVLLAVVVVAWLVGNVVVPSLLWSTRNQFAHEFHGPASVEHLVGMGGIAVSWYFFYWRAGGPGVRVEIDPTAIRVGPTIRWLGWAVPSVTIPWLQMESVTPSGRGIVIRMPEQPGQMRVVLYQGSLPTELQRLGVPLSV